MSLRRVPAVKRAGAVAPAGAFPHELLEEAEARWKASVRAPPHASQLQVRPLGHDTAAGSHVESRCTL
jgi:hypothetical protein